MPPAFFELHRRIRAGEVTEALCEGGRGGAKSSFISEEIELQMMRHPDTHAVVLRRKENTLRRTVYNQYIWAAGALGVGAAPGGAVRSVVSENTIIRIILYKRSRKTLCDRLCFYILLFFQIVVGKYIPYLLGSNPSIDLPADHDHRSQSASTDTA